MSRRGQLEMSVVHVGRAMRSLDRSGMSDDIAFRDASRALARASGALIDAIERLDDAERARLGLSAISDRPQPPAGADQ